MKPTTLRNTVVGLFVGFFLAAAIGIFVAVRIDSARQAQITALAEKQQSEVKRMLAENAVKIDTLQREYNNTVDSLNTVIVGQEVKISRLVFTVQTMKREQLMLQNAITEIRVERDSVLKSLDVHQNLSDQ